MIKNQLFEKSLLQHHAITNAPITIMFDTDEQRWRIELPRTIDKPKKVVIFSRELKILTNNGEIDFQINGVISLPLNPEKERIWVAHDGYCLDKGLTENIYCSSHSIVVKKTDAEFRVLLGHGRNLFVIPDKLFEFYSKFNSSFRQ